MLDRQDIQNIQNRQYRQNIQNNEYYRYDKSTKGCNKKCPCRIWTQCPYYIDITEQQRRIKSKSDKKSENVHNWYDKYFRIRYEHPDGFGNG
jgi:hypothetical protein